MRLLHELWQVDGKEEGSLFCLAGPLGDDARRTCLEPGAKLTWTLVAGSHFEAMTAYYKHMGWGEYLTQEEWDMQPYPDEWFNI